MEPQKSLLDFIELNHITGSGAMPTPGPAHSVLGPAAVLPAVRSPPPTTTPGRHNFRLPGLKAIIPLENLVASDF